MSALLWRKSSLRGEVSRGEVEAQRRGERKADGAWPRSAGPSVGSSGSSSAYRDVAAGEGGAVL